MKNQLKFLSLFFSLATLWSSSQAAEQKKPVKVFILAGQSNMQGKAAAYTLDAVLNDPERAKPFEHLKKDGKWTSRNDVRVTFLDNPGRGGFSTFGPLTVGYGSGKTIRNESGKKIPHPGIGHVLGDHFDEQVILIKAAWGGRAVKYSFRPPSAMPDDEVIQDQVAAINSKRDKAIRKAGENPNPKRKAKPIPPVRTFEDHKGKYGTDYRKVLSETRKVLGDLSKYIPEYDSEQGYEIAGFIWFQGWNDGVGQGNPDYTEQMAHFIRDVRRVLKVPGMPFVIGELGTDGVEAGGWIETFRKQQVEIAAKEEFQGNVLLAGTAQYWPASQKIMEGKWEVFRAAAKVNSDKAKDDTSRLDPGEYYRINWEEKYQKELSFTSDKRYHYLGSAACYYQMGESMGKAMVGVVKGK